MAERLHVLQPLDALLLICKPLVLILGVLSLCLDNLVLLRDTFGRRWRRQMTEDRGDIVIIDTEAVSLRYHARYKIVHHEIRRFVHGQEFREILEKGLEVFVQHVANKWLSDDRGNGPLKPADADWALHEWAPRVMRAGWKFWAVVMPEKVLGQMNMKRWIETYAAQGVTVKAFSDPGEAMAWLVCQ
jgi:hypothetical protein